MEKSKTSIIWKTSDRRAKRSEIWDLRVVVQHIWGTFGLLAFKVILGSFGALAIFPKMRFPKSQPKFIQLLMNYLLNGLHETAFGIWENLEIDILTNFQLSLTISAELEIEICPSSFRPLSVRVAIIPEPNARISFKFSLLLPMGHTLRHFFYFLNIFFIFYEYFSISLTWNPMGATVSKRYSYKSQPKVFKLFLNFLCNGPHKTTFGMLEILKIEILTIFIHFR